MQEIDTGTEDLLARVEDGVAVLTMNRPERRNALSPAMLDALARTLADAEADDDVGCVVLTGAGGAFCAGGDVKAMAEGEGNGISFDARVHRQRLSHRATAGRLHEMPKPTIAALGGAAAGAGLSLALACDLRYAARRAVLTTAFAKVGFAGDYGGTWFLTRLVGPARARELYFFADRYQASFDSARTADPALRPPPREALLVLCGGTEQLLAERVRAGRLRGVRELADIFCHCAESVLLGPPASHPTPLED